MLVIGGIAGAAFAALTTGALPKFADPAANRSVVYEAPPAQRSWLDEGLSALNSPAWPFGRGAHEEVPPPEPPQDYAPYGYGPPDDYDDDAWEQRQYGNHAPYQSEDYASSASAADSQPLPALPRADAADDAAARAADAAQDVISAESAP
ncbi:hypothetical protein A8V01_08405 [Novosphingobium guangzhouense]|uniref:Uncharacterized protein n=1 Tax=Novosphingobium guangzhouense TaxID=1850347 RepID=A0A2K2FUE1_9SPHN|nr:hypothetical protein A8V01_08405 [Novosphingobium guangzhouense]